MDRKKYWASKLTSVMPEADDLAIITSLLENSDFSNCHTNIRKILRAIDFGSYGPKIKSA